jgi:hypothetical protein
MASTQIMGELHDIRQMAELVAADEAGRDV